jgi:hypothetical protein
MRSVSLFISSATRWKMIENVQSFVDFCKSYGVPDSLLFMPADLIEEA